MTESIPTTESIKALVVWASVQDLPDDERTAPKMAEARRRFDAWLAEVERAAAIKAIEDASDEIELGDWSHHGNLSDRSNAEAEASTWLDKRAISLRARAAALGLTAGQEGEKE